MKQRILLFLICISLAKVAAAQLSMGTVIVNYPDGRNVYSDGTLIGCTNTPFDVQVGTHTIDLGAPVDYAPTSQTIVVSATNTSLAPLSINFASVVWTPTGRTPQGPYNRDVPPPADGGYGGIFGYNGIPGGTVTSTPTYYCILPGGFIVQCH